MKSIYSYWLNLTKKLKKNDKAKSEKNKKDEIDVEDYLPVKTKRSKLVLPEPSVSNQELKDLAKISKKNDEVQEYAMQMGEILENQAGAEDLLTFQTPSSVNPSLRSI